MNDLYNSVINTRLDQLTIGHVILLIFLALLSIFAFKISITFDWNKYLERRDQKLKLKIQNYCAHMILSYEKDNFWFKSLFESPPGMLPWYCTRCGYIKNTVNIEEEQKNAAKYFANIDQYIKREKKFESLLKKTGML